MCSDGPASSAPLLVPPGVALMPDDFPERLEAVRNLFDLNCEEMAVALGVDPRQLMRWRIKGGGPNGGALRPDRPTGPCDASRQEVDHPSGPGPSLIRVAAQGAAEDIGAGCRAASSIGDPAWSIGL